MNPSKVGQIADNQKHWANLHLVLNEAVSIEAQKGMEIFEFYECYAAWQPVLDARRKNAENHSS